jgi:hypothetical protein
MATTIEEIQALVKRLPPERQKQVLEYARGLTQPERAISSLPKTPLPPGTSGAALLTTLFNLKIPVEDIDAMERALEDCERIEPDEY